MERRAAQDTAVDLVDSGQFLTAEEIFSERRTDDPKEMVVRAEVALYFARLDEAAELLRQVAPRIVDINVAARFSLTKGRVALWQADLAEAALQLQTAYHFYTFQSDMFGLSQALLNLARLARESGELADAASKLDDANNNLTGRTSRRTEYLRGLIASEQAAVAADSGEIEQAKEVYTEACRQLKGTEKGRFYGRSLVGMADLRCALGDFMESLEIYKEANTTFERHDIRRDLAESQLKLATALIRLKRYERAEKLAEESQALQRGDAEMGSAALATLAILALQQGEAEKASGYAKQAVEQATPSPRVQSRIRARIALGQVEIAEREFKQAADTLREAADAAHASNSSSANRRLELEAVIYLAEAYHNTDTRAGRAELLRASELLNNLEDAWLGDEYNRVSTKYEEQIVFTDDNRLVFDGNQLPRWQEAKRTLEGFLLRNALRQTNNSLTRAARKLGVSKVHVHNLKKKHNL
jgi:tetratricopeptide (TPR) repeat protein